MAGFLNSLLNAVKSGAGSALQDATIQAVNSVIQTVADEVTSDGDAQSETVPEGARQQPIQTIEFTNPVIPADSEIFEVEDFDCNNQGEDVILKYSFPMAEGFDMFDCGAGEILASFVYPPNPDEYYDEIDFETMAILYMGEDGHIEKIIDEYEKKGIVKDGCTVEKVTGSFVNYRTISYRDGHELIAYHFHPKYHNEYYLQIAIDIPSNLKNHRAMLINAMECMIAGMQVSERPSDL